MVQSFSTLLFAVAVLSAAAGPSVAHSDGRSREQMPVQIAVETHGSDETHIPSWMNSMLRHGHSLTGQDHVAHPHKHGHGHHRVHMMGNFVGHGHKYAHNYGHYNKHGHLHTHGDFIHGHPHVYGHWHKHVHGYGHSHPHKHASHHPYGHKHSHQHVGHAHWNRPTRHRLAKVHLDQGELSLQKKADAAVTHDDVDHPTPVPSRAGRGSIYSKNPIKLARETSDINARDDALFIPVDEIVARSVWASVEDLD